MKRFIATLAILLLFTGTSFGQFWKEKIHSQVLTFADIGADDNSADLGEVDCGSGALILWFEVDGTEGPSDDYDIFFFTEDQATWDASTNPLVDANEMIYKVVGINTTYYKDDTLFPFVCTDNTDKMYVGIYNDGTASEFEVRVFWTPRRGANLAEWTAPAP